MPVTSYSTTAASNNSAPPAGAPEGMAPSAVNDTIRAVMADIAVEAQTNAVKYLGSVAGTNTITCSMSPALTAYAAGMIVVVKPANDTTGAATININSLGAKSIVKEDGRALESGDMQASTAHVLVYDGTNFVLLNPMLLVNQAGALNSSAAEVGFKGLPQNVQNSSYSFVLGDSGKHVISTSGTGGITYTIPANASVAFPIGSVLTIANFRSSGDITIAITSDTLLLAGAGSTGSRTLAVNGLATALKITSTAWVVSGTGLS